MKWTTEKPTKPGWYWFKDHSYKYIMYINPDIMPNGKDGYDGKEWMFSWEALWAGPIEEPEDD